MSISAGAFSFITYGLIALLAILYLYLIRTVLQKDDPEEA